MENITDQFIDAVSRLGSFEDCYTFFEGLFSDEELQTMAQRLEIAKQLMDQKVYSDIVTSTDASSLTVNRVDRSLQSGGLEEVLAQLNRYGTPESYGAFAYIYDKLTRNVDYIARVAYVEKIFKRFGKNPSLVLDLACGTGSASLLLAQKGYEVIGVDGSEDMLYVASQKAKDKGLDILFLRQRMEEFELFGTVDAVICLLDSLNYITDFAALKQVFKLVHNYLNPNGIFIFDINTRHMLKDVLPGNAITDTENDNVIYTWESYYDEKKHICEFVLNFFVEQDGLYSRFTEVHHQKAYTTANIKSALAGAGLKLVGAFDDLSFNLPRTSSTKTFFVAIKD